jgi:dihydrolipoamide dehydrogenase
MQYDVIVIGSGPGGYVAAIRCAQLGLKTAIVEKYKTLGGTCLNVGCIPSKALLDSSEHFYNAAHTFAEHGIKLADLQVDLSQMIKRKEGVVEANVTGISFLMKKNKITVHQGFGSFVDANTLKVKKDDGSEEQITTKNFIIATGSKPSSFPSMQIDKKTNHQLNRSPDVTGNSETPHRDWCGRDWRGVGFGVCPHRFESVVR